MYFCYVDESGDCGAWDANNPYSSGTQYLILSGLIVPAKNWKPSLDVLKSYRKRLAAQGFLPYDVEFHCAELIDPKKIKAYTQLSTPDRWKLLEGFAETIGQHGSFSIIPVIIDKSKSPLKKEDYLTEAITKIYQAFDEFLRVEKENGILFFDRANENVVTTHVRKLLNTGSSGITIPGIRIGWIVEDPLYRASSDSIFIQAADVIVYSLKEKEFPISARKKFQADRIYQRKLNGRNFRSSFGDPDGFIRI